MRTNYICNFLVFIAIFFIMLSLVYFPAYFDFPIERIINNVAIKLPILDRLLFNLDTYYSLSGVILVAFVWACWFGDTDLETRARILVGSVVSLGAAGISRFLQHALSSHPRPIYDTAFEFHRPGSHIPSFNAWNSFPSDHATAFGGLVIVVFLARPRLGLLAGVWFCVLELSRAYMGAHYPSDLVGGAALGASLVFLGQLPAAISCGKRVVLWERSSPALFYMVAFFVSYQIATLFQDFRYMMSGGLAGAVQLLHELVKLISHQ